MDAEQAGIADHLKETWKMIDLRVIPEEHRKACFRLNALGSSYFFGRAVLNYRNLSPTLHYGMCKSVEKERLREVREYPRGCFKTTIFSITMPMWWALPFTENDERLMRGLGYGEEWIRWMRRAHDRNTSTLILSETDENAEKMGKEISAHYKENEVFKTTFSEIMPDKSSTWNMSSMMHKRQDCFFREGTYELAGVGKALQSRHYPRIVEDDLWGEKALYSLSEAEYTINFHQNLPGLYRPDAERPDHIGDNVVVGNRWAVNDLNGWIRKNQKDYHVESHSIDGGCCEVHPKGSIIFPEMFTFDKLKQIQQSFGPTKYAAQMLNDPLDDSNRRFKPEWLQHYSLELTPHPNGVRDEQGRMKMLSALQHEVWDGRALPNVFISELYRFIVVDVLHDEEQKIGRSRHAVMTLGYLPSKKRLYILNAWAERTLFDNMTAHLFKMADRWRVDRIWVEVLAGQDGWLKYFRLMNQNRESGKRMKVMPLKKDRSAGAKHRRIDELEPYFSNGMIWASRGDAGYLDFRTEYDQWKSNQTIDLLDTLGYFPQCIQENMHDAGEIRDFMNRREQQITSAILAGAY